MSNLWSLILQKFTLKNISKVLSDYANLYVKAPLAWKKVLNYQNKSYDFLVLHLIYYFFVIFLLIANMRSDYSIYKIVLLSVNLVILEIIITIIPFIIFIIPFLILKKLFNKRIQYNRLFWLLLILKIQFTPIALLLITYYNWSANESIFIVVDNLTFVVLVAFICVLPLSISLNLWQRVIWIISNYVFVILFIIFLALITYNNESSLKNFNKIILQTPNNEFVFNQIISPNIYWDLNDRYYIVITDSITGNVSAHFCTWDLLQSILKTNVNRNNDRLQDIRLKIRKNDSIIKSIDPSFISDYDYEKDTMKYYPKNEEINLIKFDSISNIIKTKFIDDFNKTIRYKDSSIYLSNREFYTTYYDYLNYYQISYSDSNEIKKIIMSKKKESMLIFGDKTLSMYNLDSLYYEPYRGIFISNYNDMVKRSDLSLSIYNILFFPIKFLAFLIYV